MIKSGLAFHCHHDVLFERVFDYDERVEYIKRDKPEGEQELRLRLFRLIPDDRIPGRDSPQWEAYVKAREAYYETRGAYYKARGAYDKAFGKEIEELHKEICPDCPWDGETIFPSNKEG